MLSWFQLYCYVTNGISIALNTLLLAVSSHKSIEAIHELRYFLTNISIVGMVVSLLILVIQPQMVCRGSMTIWVPHGIAQTFSDHTLNLLTSTAFTFYLYGMMSFPLFFVYRSMILANSTVYGQYFNKKNLLATFVVIFIFCCVEGAFLFFSNISHEDLFDRLNRSSSALSAFDTTTSFPVLRPSDFPPTNHSGPLASEEIKPPLPLIGNDYSRIPLILFFHGISIVVHLLSYVIILVSAHFIMNTLKKKQSSMSRDTVQANQLLVHAVFAEAFLPLLFSAPIAANALLTTFYENSLVWQEFLPTYFISLVPLLSPLISLSFIAPYRHTVIGILSLRFLRPAPVPSPQINDAEIDEKVIQAVLSESREVVSSA